MSELVVVSSYWFPGDADVAKNALDAAGIESFIDDQNIVRLNWLNANAVHGVKLRVRNEDALRAGEVLNERCQLLAEVEEAHEEPLDPTVCAECGSTEVVRHSRLIPFLAITLMAIAFGAGTGNTDVAFFAIAAAAVFAAITDRWRCQTCGESWN